MKTAQRMIRTALQRHPFRVELTKSGRSRLRDYDYLFATPSYLVGTYGDLLRVKTGGRTDSFHPTFWKEVK
jgi:hypothetical protein